MKKEVTHTINEGKIVDDNGITHNLKLTKSGSISISGNDIGVRLLRNSRTYVDLEGKFIGTCLDLGNAVEYCKNYLRNNKIAA